MAHRRSESKIAETFDALGSAAGSTDSKVDGNLDAPGARATPARRRASVDAAAASSTADAALAAAQRLLARLEVTEPSPAAGLSRPPPSPLSPAAQRPDRRSHATALRTSHAAPGMREDRVGGAPSLPAQPLGTHRSRSGSGDVWSASTIRAAAGLAALLDPAAAASPVALISPSSSVSSGGGADKPAVLPSPIAMQGVVRGGGRGGDWGARSSDSKVADGAADGASYATADAEESKSARLEGRPTPGGLPVGGGVGGSQLRAPSGRRPGVGKAPAADAPSARGAPVGADGPGESFSTPGFRIVQVGMRDCDSGRVVWEARDVNPRPGDPPLDARLPASLLRASAASRQVTFASADVLHRLRMAQVMWLQLGGGGGGSIRWLPLERNQERLGFVMPGSTNTWEGIVESADAVAEQRGGAQAAAAASSSRPSAADLSGRLFVETSFSEGERLLARSTLRVWYDAPP